MAKADLEVTVDIETLRQTVEAVHIAAGSITGALETLAMRLFDIQAQQEGHDERPVENS